MVLTGFKTEANAVAQPPSLFFQPTLENFTTALLDANYVGFFLNSVYLSVGSTMLAFVARRARRL